jgi:hypothetical protein
MVYTDTAGDIAGYYYDAGSVAHGLKIVISRDFSWDFGGA